jgi:hypothetical protein
MIDPVKDNLPDLIIGKCPLGCNETCSVVWTNDTIGHRIVCNCVCHYKKDAALVRVERPNSKAVSTHNHPRSLSR